MSRCSEDIPAYAVKTKKQKNLIKSTYIIFVSQSVSRLVGRASTCPLVDFQVSTVELLMGATVLAAANQLSL